MSLNPNRPTGPSLNALRAFEAAVRLESFRLAAIELSVTPAAISQHVKTLENWLGDKLFHRKPNGIEVSNLGREIAKDVSSALDLMGSAVHKLRNSRANKEIAIAALPAIAQLWLPHHLPILRQAFAPAPVSIYALEELPLLSRELFDISLFYRPPDPEKNEIILGYDRIFPVCAPSLASRLTDIESMAEFPILRDNDWARDWELWLETTTVPTLSNTRGSVYSLYSLAIEEARNAVGVLIGHSALVEADLAAGRLVAPFEHSVQTGNALVMEFAPGYETSLIFGKLSQYFMTEPDSATMSIQ